MQNNQLDLNKINNYASEGRKTIHRIIEECRDIRTNLKIIRQNIDNLKELNNQRSAANINVTFNESNNIYTLSSEVYQYNNALGEEIRNIVRTTRIKTRDDIISELKNIITELKNIEASTDKLHALLYKINTEAETAAKNSTSTNINWGDILFATSAATTGAEDEFSAQNGTGNGIDPNNKYLYNATLRFRKASEVLLENNPGRETNSYAIEKWDGQNWVPMKWISEDAMKEVLQKYEQNQQELKKIQNISIGANIGAALGIAAVNPGAGISLLSQSLQQKNAMNNIISPIQSALKNNNINLEKMEEYKKQQSIQSQREQQEKAKEEAENNPYAIKARNDIKNGREAQATQQRNKAHLKREGTEAEVQRQKEQQEKEAESAIADEDPFNEAQEQDAAKKAAEEKAAATAQEREKLKKEAENNPYAKKMQEDWDEGTNLKNKYKLETEETEIDRMTRQAGKDGTYVKVTYNNGDSINYFDKDDPNNTDNKIQTIHHPNGDWEMLVQEQDGSYTYKDSGGVVTHDYDISDSHIPFNQNKIPIINENQAPSSTTTLINKKNIGNLGGDSIAPISGVVTPVDELGATIDKHGNITLPNETIVINGESHPGLAGETLIYDKNTGQYETKSGNASFTSAEIWSSPTIQNHYSTKESPITILPTMNPDDTRILTDIYNAKTDEEREKLINQLSSPEGKAAVENLLSKNK